MTQGATETGERRKRRPWYRLHLATWVALAVVAGGLAYCNGTPWPVQAAKFQVRSWSYQSDIDIFGWPMEFLYRVRTTNIDYVPGTLTPKATRVRTRPYFDWHPITVDALVALVMLGSTVVLVESHLRSRHRWHQVTLANLLMLTAVLAALLAFLYSQDAVKSALGESASLDRVLPDVDRPGSLRHYLTNIRPGDRKFPIWVCLPLLFGIGCAFYVAIGLGVYLVGRVLRGGVFLRRAVAGGRLSK